MPYRGQSTFDSILLTGIRAGQIPARTEEARNWYRNMARKQSDLTDVKFMRENVDRLKNRNSIGQMVMYYYDAKHKDTLPYYDMFPIIFPIEKYKDGWLGINMHYLPYKQRAQLMDALYTLTNNDRYDESTKMQISYGVLKSASRYRLFQPCIKRYLSSQLRSRFIPIHASEWDIALFLPLANFSGASQAQVWKDSLDAQRSKGSKK